MAAEKTGGNRPANAGGGNTNSNANKGQGKSNRRRSLRSKRRGRKPEEGSAAREQRSEPRSEQRSEPRSEPRGEQREGREPRALSNASKSVDKSVRENRERRRRRRMRAKQRGQNETTTVVVEDTFKDLPPLVPAFVYTHVLRPSMRDSFEFRTEHFSKVTRKLEDFHIDLSPLYPDGGDEIKGVAYMPPLAESAEFARDFDPDYDPDAELEGSGEGEERYATPDTKVYGAEVDGAEAYEMETYDNPDWDAEESNDAARLDGAMRGEMSAAIADDFYEDLDDSVVDEYPEEDIDA